MWRGQGIWSARVWAEPRLEAAQKKEVGVAGSALFCPPEMDVGEGVAVRPGTRTLICLALQGRTLNASKRAGLGATVEIMLLASHVSILASFLGMVRTIMCCPQGEHAGLLCPPQSCGDMSLPVAVGQAITPKSTMAGVGG